MKMSCDWNYFKEHLNKLLPPLNEAMPAPIELENDNGQEL